jgi:hypothetical protein
MGTLTSGIEDLRALEVFDREVFCGELREVKLNFPTPSGLYVFPIKPGLEG